VNQVIEALRAVRLNLAHAYGAAGPLLVTITSPGPGDGKSFVSGNLARAFADMGRRTLLIDGDTRRGVLHRVLKLSRRPGLIDYLSEGLAFERIVQATDHRSLSFIGSGSRSGDSPELLGSPAMVRLMAAARAAFDVVVVDSPPLGAGIDPLVLAALTGSMVMVLRTGATNLEMTQMRLQGIERLPIRVLGAVLNDVRPGGVYKYYSYLSGYAAEDEERSGSKTRVALARGLPGGG
jgi:tyrosine-protein kinase Etk/Wzc